jgi:hypothetical protein
MPQPTDARALHDVLVTMPLEARLSALVVSIVLDDPRAVSAVASIIGVAGIMARRLSPGERAALAWALREEAENLDATWQ